MVHALRIINIALVYWKNPSIAATGLSKSDIELMELKIVLPIFFFIFFTNCFVNSLLDPSKFLT